MTIAIGISTCPNDTFAFHGILRGQVDTRGLDLKFRLADVEELNLAFLAGELDVSKVSFAAALEAADRLVVLPSGAALGFGVGPVVLARQDHPIPPRPRVLAPGRHTTAALLHRLLHPEIVLDHDVFSEIIPALVDGRCDQGVCIHEGRFTWQDHGLRLVEDLGRTWEELTGMALPLGGLCAWRSVPTEELEILSLVISESISYGHSHRRETVETMSKYAQEFDEEVLFAHVDLYVNEQTLDLGEAGTRALDSLVLMAAGAGLVRASTRLQILGQSPQGQIKSP